MTVRGRFEEENGVIRQKTVLLFVWLLANDRVEVEQPFSKDLIIEVLRLKNVNLFFPDEPAPTKELCWGMSFWMYSTATLQICRWRGRRLSLFSRRPRGGIDRRRTRRLRRDNTAA